MEKIYALFTKYDFLTWVSHAMFAVFLQLLTAVFLDLWAGAAVGFTCYYFTEALQAKYRKQKVTGQSLIQLTFYGYLPWQWKFDAQMDLYVPTVAVIGVAILGDIFDVATPLYKMFF